MLIVQDRAKKSPCVEIANLWESFTQRREFQHGTSAEEMFLSCKVHCINPHVLVYRDPGCYPEACLRAHQRAICEGQLRHFFFAALGTSKPDILKFLSGKILKVDTLVLGSEKRLSIFFVGKKMVTLKSYDKHLGMGLLSVKVEPSEGLATIWCKGAQDAMKLAGLMQKSYFMGRKACALASLKFIPPEKK